MGLFPRRQHEPGRIEPDDLDPDPFVQFHRWFAEAREVEPVEPDAMTLSTASADGRPSARTVLLKELDDRGFVFFTNYGSRKGRELAENPYAALTFLWRVIGRQVLVTGEVHRVTIEESAAYFATRPRGSRLGAWASRQGRVLASRDELEDRYAQLEVQYAGTDDIPLPPWWGGYRLVPDAVELWQGRPDRLHDRLRYSRPTPDGPWTIQRVSP